MRATRHGLAILFLSCLVALGATPVAPRMGLAAESLVLAEAAKRKINLAGRQRMLSQRMAMLTCMVDAGVLPEPNLIKARDAAALFARTLNGLRHGDEGQGLSVEVHADVLADLTVVDRLWLGYGAAIDTFLARPDKAPLREIHDRNGPVLVNMNKAVVAMEAIYGDGLISEELAIALNIAGRQRMLIMKALNEACMITRGFAVDADRRLLARTVAVFESSLYKLRVGNDFDRIIAPPSFEIEMQLELVQMIWDWMSPRLKEIAKGDTPDPLELTRLFYHGEIALREMNTGVWMYENF